MKKSKPRVRIKSAPTRLFLAVLTAFIIAVCSLCSCSVVRTVTNESQYVQKGDTSVLIQTKTIEKYDGSKKYLLLNN